MVTDNHYRWDFIGLSTDTKPTPATSKKVVDGSTYYCSDTSKLYVYCTDDWYERKPLGGGGGGVNVVQTTGTSTTDVMSQNATTSMIYADPGTNTKIGIGYISTLGTDSVAIGSSSQATGARATAIGRGASASHRGAVAIGAGASTSTVGEFNIASNSTQYGYNGTQYRLLTGLHDPVNAHDAVTKGYVDANAGGGARVLTTDDYNYDKGNTGSNNCVALWLLPAGLYSNSNGVNVLVASTYSFNTNNRTYLVSKSDSTNDDNVQIICFKGKALADRVLYTLTSLGTGINPFYFLSSADTVNNLNSLDTSAPLSANQGRILGNRIKGSLTSAPSTSTVGEVGSLLATVESGTGHLYICTDDTGGTYTWQQLV